MVIDINCDVGEGVGNEAGIFPYITTCNIACGGHAGDPETMERVVGLAAEHSLRIGAHPSYPDKENFGRKSMVLPAAQLKDSIRSQIASLQSVMDKEGLALHHIKAHGALYNDLSTDPGLGEIFLEAVAEYREECLLFIPYGSSMARWATDKGFNHQIEAFADRAYLSDYQLAPRSMEKAVLDDPQQVSEHLTRMVKDNEVMTIDGQRIPMHASTYCIHGDTPSALQILMYLSQELPRHGIYLKK